LWNPKSEFVSSDIHRTKGKDIIFAHQDVDPRGGDVGEIEIVTITSRDPAAPAD
jgi:hypothetical protein